MKDLEEYGTMELVEAAKELIDNLNWLVRAYEDEFYHARWQVNVADAVADVKAAQKDFNRKLRAYSKVASRIYLD